MEGIKKSTPPSLDINEDEQNSKDENKVDMNGFCFFVNTCEEKLNEFLENYFCNKTYEELKYTEENQGTNNCINNYSEKNDNTNAENNDNYISSHNTNSNTVNNEDNSDNDSSNENEKNYYEKKIIKSNYDRIALNLVDTVEQFMEPYVNERYKIVVHAIIGENKKQGIHIASKSLWNVETDNYVSAKYVNDYIFVTVMIIVFIVSLSIKPGEFLTPSGSILVTLGANVASKIKNGEIHRLILPIFLHANIFHAFFNVFFQLRMGFTLEKNYGILKVAILYFVTGIYGNILSSSVTYCTTKVGASTSGMGLLGIVTSELILLWHIIRHRERVVFNILFFALISILYYFTFNGSNIDHVGHLGGLLSGISIGMLYNEKMENKPTWYNSARFASYACLALLAIVPTVVLFAVPRVC
ncbi:hypothetical protein YYG_01757 [Plasmodium vinckei petteri]|uniref:Rhomboid-like protease n=1 Tax=Plasmodium vinckei petteri TaxID=138298 RepID=W7AH59_PLAVN|nr:hypothetical protein YYG_01757 [Plasmodium vinckei petteri]